MKIKTKIKTPPIKIDTVDIEEGLGVPDGLLGLTKENVLKSARFDVKRSIAMVKIQDVVVQAINAGVLLNPDSAEFRQFGELLKQINRQIFLENFGPDRRFLKRKKRG